MKFNIIIASVFICTGLIFFIYFFSFKDTKEIANVSNQIMDTYDYQKFENLKKIDCINSDHMHKAAARGYISFVKKCLELGVSPNIKEKFGWTPLHSASRHGYLTIVKLLVENGAKIDIADITGRNSLDQAIISGNKELITYLEKLDVNRQ